MDHCPIQTNGIYWRNPGDWHPQNEGHDHLPAEIFAEEAERPLWVAIGLHLAPDRFMTDIQLCLWPAARPDITRHAASDTAMPHGAAGRGVLPSFHLLNETLLFQA